MHKKIVGYISSQFYNMINLLMHTKFGVRLSKTEKCRIHFRACQSFNICINFNSNITSVFLFARSFINTQGCCTYTAVWYDVDIQTLICKILYSLVMQLTYFISNIVCFTTHVYQSNVHYDIACVFLGNWHKCYQILGLTYALPHFDKVSYLVPKFIILGI